MFRRQAIICLLFLATTPLSGCAYFRDLKDVGRLQRGRVLVLPGIETPSVFNSNVATGLSQSQWNGAIEIHDWTTGIFFNFPLHLCGLKTNLSRAQELADKIVAYQDDYPDAPIHLIGHSGGGALIVLALEALPTDRHITSAILIAPAISPDHDLSVALSKSKAGIWHFHSGGDLLLLVAGTTLLGTVDREHRPAAGAFGFNRPVRLSAFERQLYDQKLHEVPYNLGMLKDGNIGEHFGATTVRFSRNHFAPILLQADSDHIEPTRERGREDVGDD